MKPYPVTFHLYADDEIEIDKLRRSLYDLVSTCYQEGIYITASKLNELLKKVNDNPVLKQILK